MLSSVVGRANIAILDGAGRILYVNRNWRDFSLENGGPAWWLGVDYLGVCRRVEGPERRLALEVAGALEAVLERRQNEFRADYPCDAPDTRRQYHMRLYPWAPVGAAAFHLDVTSGLESDLRLIQLQQHYGKLRQFLAEAATQGCDPQWLTSVCIRLVDELPLQAACLAGLEEGTSRLKPLTWFGRNGTGSADFRVEVDLDQLIRGRAHQVSGGVGYLALGPDRVLAWLPEAPDVTGEELDLLVSIADVLRLALGRDGGF